MLDFIVNSSGESLSQEDPPLQLIHTNTMNMALLTTGKKYTHKKSKPCAPFTATSLAIIYCLTLYKIK